jgi:hypothetical protein
MGWDLALVKLAFKLKALELVTSKIMFHCFLETEDNDPFFINGDNEESNGGNKKLRQ